MGTKLVVMLEPGWGAYGRRLGAALLVSESIPCRPEAAGADLDVGGANLHLDLQRRGAAL